MNLQESIKRILREESNFSLKVRRRFTEMDSSLAYIIKKFYAPNMICGYKDSKDLFEHISHSVIEIIYYEYFEDIDDLSDEWEQMYYMMAEYLKNKHGAAIDEYYHLNCGN
jgi:archaellum biogenesis protein FlaJ (TadC family)